MTITIEQLSKQLEEFLKNNPERANDGVFVHISELTQVEEDINEINLIDFTISDRVDINIG